MGMWGYLHRVPAKRLPELLADPAQISDDLFPNDDVERYPTLTVEKTWNAIEFILDRLAEAGQIPWIGPLTEGEKTGAEFHYGDCWYRTSDQVREISNAISGLSKEDLREAYLPELMAANNVYPDIWGNEVEKERNFEYVWHWYKDMVEFYQAAATSGDGMLLHLG